MSVGGIAAGVAFLFQITGGATLGMVAGSVIAQQNGNGVELDPALAAAYGAIGALFGLVTWLAKGRIERCERREDALLNADSEKNITLRELVATVGKSADVTQNAVTAANGAIEESKRNGTKLDTLIELVRDIRDAPSGSDGADSTIRRR